MPQHPRHVSCCCCLCLTARYMPPSLGLNPACRFPSNGQPVTGKSQQRAYTVRHGRLAVKGSPGMELRHPVRNGCKCIEDVELVEAPVKPERGCLDLDLASTRRGRKLNEKLEKGEDSALTTIERNADTSTEKSELSLSPLKRPTDSCSLPIW